MRKEEKHFLGEKKEDWFTDDRQMLLLKIFLF
jgi:hypothetical protein